MISLNDVLLAMSNIPVDDPIAEIWGRGLQGGYKIIEYTGTLPITITANGNALIDYRIYGASGGVGEPTESGEPVGYKLPIAITDKNLLADNFSQFGDGFINITGSITQPDTARKEKYSDYISIAPNTSYTFAMTNGFPGSPSGDFNEQPWRVVAFYGQNKTFISRLPVEALNPNPVTVTSPSDAFFARVSWRSYGSEECPVLVTSRNVYPVYIGDTPLGEDEYVDYGEQKVYKYMVPENTGNTVIYGFHINPDDPDPSSAVTYLEDAVGMIPASIGLTVFNYGSWQNVFFMPRPCMLKFDGTVDYYLDPNDYSKKADGVTPSDYNNLAYQGNAMMEFPLIWYKYVPGVAEGEGYFYVSNHKVNDTYKCWSNMDCDGNIIEHFYMPIYNGCTYDGKMRSISGLTLATWSTTAYSASATYVVGDKVNYDGKMWKCIAAVETAEAFDENKWEQFAFNANTTATEEITQATANNTTTKTEWYIDMWCDRVLINGLLVLISKSIDTQGKFGRGVDSGSQVAKESYVTGSLDDKGLFYGSTTNGTTAVKVFGMENWWSLAWHRTAGLIGGANNVYLYKMTFSTTDGSIVDGYNTSGTGYPSVGGKPTMSNYIKKMQFGLFGFLPIEVGSYSTQYYKDYYYNGTGFALVGGYSSGGAGGGAFSVALDYGAGRRYWIIGTAPSCKPLAKLSPTDPPVPLPEIPTIKGETVIDYDGDPKPSQMYVKYKGKG